MLAAVPSTVLAAQQALLVAQAPSGVGDTVATCCHSGREWCLATLTNPLDKRLDACRGKQLAVVASCFSCMLLRFMCATQAVTSLQGPGHFV